MKKIKKPIEQRSKESIATLKDKVEYILYKFPSTRDCDVELTLMVYVEFFKNRIVYRNDRIYIPASSLFVLPTQDNIRRIRAYFQNTKGKYPPCDPDTIKRRGTLECVWKSEMSK